MPEALARTDFDFTVQERPQRPRVSQGQKRSPPRRDEPGLSAQVTARLAGVLQRNPGRSVVTLGLCCFAGIFMLNALWLQHGHRHALDLPLYHQAIPAQITAHIPLPPQRPAMVTTPAGLITPNTLPMLAPLPPQERADGALAQGDGIARLLGERGAVASADAPKFSARAEGVQRALLRLGYKISVDGVYGRTTRSAIAKFEHAANLPETGNMGARMRAALAKRAGLAIP